MGDTPNIRFKGFADAWEQRKLADWGTFYYGRSCPKWSVTEDATIPCIRYGELYTKFGAKIDKVYSYTNMSPENLRFSKGTEVLIPRVGEEPMDYNHCTWLSMPNVAIGEMISVFNTENNPLFTATMFNATLRNEFAMRVEGGSVTNLYFEKLKNIDVSFPVLEEQEKIASYFDTLDHLITLHQRKCDEIIELKKYMLQKMFPQNSQKVPELRFAGFTGDWEQHKFSNIVMEKLTNGVMNQQSASQTDVKHINVINMYVSDKIHVEDLTYSSCDNNAVEKCNVEVGDIFLTRSSLKPEGIAEPNVLLDDGCFVFDDHLIRMKVNKEKYDPLFTKILLSTKPVKKQFIAKSKQNAFTTIGQEDIAESEGLFPSLSEQQEIGKYFSNIDNLITFHQHKCDELKEIKKFMLQNMFPQKG